MQGNTGSTHPPRRRKRLGQVFLESESAIVRIVESLELQVGEAVLEIGGGDGRLSERIAPQARKLIIVELDRRFAELLRGKFADREGVKVVEGDILAEETMAEVRALEPKGKLVVYGSLPYYITSPILRWIAERPGDFSRAVVLVQREVARRATAHSGSREYGFLSFVLQRRAYLKAGRVIRSGAFRPVPKVDSQLLTLVPKADLDSNEERRLERFVAPLFEQRRKKLRNSLAAYIGGVPGQELAEECFEAGISLDLRPEMLSPDQFHLLHKLVTSNASGGSDGKRSKRRH
jgi:16S rRNA (adenine1518-N6/adenine1519-N6)-dimethyltransferase